jgi:type IV secretory pathway protease TraF
MSIPRTVVEIIEPTETPGQNVCHLAREVRINGVPVLVKEDGIDITFGAQEITTVTLEILPTEIHFRSAAPYEEDAA